MDMNTLVKKRRKALGLSQAVVAARVKELSGTDFTQQSLARFENKPGAQSTFLHYILRTLDEAEGKTLPSANVAMVRDGDPPAYAEIVSKLHTADAQGKLSDSLRSAILNMIDAAVPDVSEPASPVLATKNAPSIEQAQLMQDLKSNTEGQIEFKDRTLLKIRKKTKNVRETDESATKKNKPSKL